MGMKMFTVGVTVGCYRCGQKWGVYVLLGELIKAYDGLLEGQVYTFDVVCPVCKTQQPIHLTKEELRVTVEEVMNDVELLKF